MPEPAAKPRCADFLVIGAMKCGTTTLYHDLRRQPGIFLPDKESNLLLQDVVPAVFSKAGSGQCCGEVCPDYAKLPDIDGVAATAATAGPKIIYLVRHPVDRMISHHHFISSWPAPRNRGMGQDIDVAVANFPELVNYSRYAYQLKPWIDHLGRDSVLVMRFEDYVKDRAGSVRAICEFIGVDFEVEQLEDDAVHNASSARPVLTPFWKKIRENALYRSVVRPFTSLEMRDRIRRWILPAAKGRPAPPSPETLAGVTAAFRSDLLELQEMLGHEAPLWDLD